MRHIRVVSIAIVCALFVSICAGQKLVKKLSNQDVIDMVSLGLSDDVVIEKIRTAAATDFDTSIEALKTLKAAKVSDSIIRVMINPRTSFDAQTSPASAASNGSSPMGSAADSGLPEDPGMFLEGPNGFTNIIGQTIAFSRSGSKFASAMTYGIKAQHRNAQISGAHAHTVTNSTPIFVFIPSQHETENGVTVADLVLVTLDVRGDRRQIELGAAGAARESSGITLTHQVDTVKSQRASHKYEVKPAQPLKKGEYAFYLARSEGLPAMLYDFSVE